MRGQDVEGRMKGQDEGTTLDRDDRSRSWAVVGGLLIYFKSVLNYMAPGGVVAVASAKWHGTARPRPQPQPEPQHGAYLGATFDFWAARRATTNKFR